jgi:hypothetical protein
VLLQVLQSLWVLHLLTDLAPQYAVLIGAVAAPAIKWADKTESEFGRVLDIRVIFLVQREATLHPSGWGVLFLCPFKAGKMASCGTFSRRWGDCMGQG